MSVTIRLSKVGKRNAPSYKIVVSNTRDKRYGRFLDILGYYNPSTNPTGYKLDESKYNDWISKGALVTDAVVQLKEGTYVFKPYRPNAKPEETQETSVEAEPETIAEETVSEEPASEEANKEE
jgi:small subunit ribosomal protein S16